MPVLTLLHKEFPWFGKVAIKELQPVSSKKVTQCCPPMTTCYTARLATNAFLLGEKKNRNLERLAAGELMAASIAWDIETFISVALTAGECDDVCSAGGGHVCDHRDDSEGE